MTRVINHTVTTGKYKSSSSKYVIRSTTLRSHDYRQSLADQEQTSIGQRQNRGDRPRRHCRNYCSHRHRHLGIQMAKTKSTDSRRRRQGSGRYGDGEEVG